MLTVEVLRSVQSLPNPTQLIGYISIMHANHLVPQSH